MFYSVDDNIVKLEGGFPQRKVNSISFTIDDAGFPISNATGHGQLGIASKKPINIQISTGSNVYSFSSNYQQNSTYYLSITSDGQTINGFNQGATSGYFNKIDFINPIGSQKTITIIFENIESIIELRLSQFNIYGALPNEIKSMISLNSLSFNVLRHITSFPTDLSPLINLKELNLRILSSSKFDKIPDSFFNLDLERFQASSVFDCSNEVSSNLFKVNQWTNMINLDLRDNNINYLPSDWQSMANTLTTLRIDSNEYTYLPPALSLFSNINRFDFGINNSVRQPWFDMSLWNQLSTMYIYGDIGISDISSAWIHLFSLRSINNFHSWINNTTDFNEFINAFYTLCTNEAYLDTSTPTAQADEYPNKFRDISWGHSSLTPTGNYQAPTGFVLGVSNGNPANEAEKIYVLVNNYGHTVTFNQS
ncbi:hypothetical protein LX95_01307 [Mesonia algae]|uniref:Leucine rich repeat (LRR) protein n=1 Tax=Mesonia algae TaxID=213248 RepID=A0A2W7I478_9FLAO|nr:hypothetical protein [Mesonia algae]PZW41626.1 hypothetical protein LX95_01307 [Mesonia algae]